MIILKLIVCKLIWLTMFLVFFGCKENEVTGVSNYNQKANEVIEQVIIDNSHMCECLIEIPNTSMIEAAERDTPHLDLKKTLMRELKLKSKLTLDSLEHLSSNFKLDSTILIRHDIKLVSKEILAKARYDIKICPKGIIGIRKPIFDKDFKNAAVDYGFTGRCIPMPLAIYSVREGKWFAN